MSRTFVGLLSLGTLLEWAEYTFYGYVAIRLSLLFFPNNAPDIALLKTFGIFAVGYMARPLGALFFGYVGDRKGRQKALQQSLCLMGVATLGIGCLPTYSTIGYLAPLLLLLLRALQGMAVSGEFHGAGIALTEHAPPQKACLAGAWVNASAAAGMVLGGIAALLVSHPLAPLWAWRVPFGLGGLSCLLGWYLRRWVPREIISFPSEKSDRWPLWVALKYHRKALLVTATVAAFTGILVYIGNVYIVSFLHQQTTLSVTQAMLFAIEGESVVMIGIPLIAWLADRTDPYRLYRFGLLATAGIMPLCFQLCLQGETGGIALAMLGYGVVNSMVSGPVIKILCDQFPQKIRYSSIAFAWSVAAALFSGTAPFVAQWLVTHHMGVLSPSWYVGSMALLTYGVMHFWALERRERPGSPFRRDTVKSVGV